MIHKPGKKFSNIPFGNKNNPMQYQKISNEILITTETWNNSLPQPMKFGSDFQYKLIMTWKKGQTYAVTKVLNSKRNY